ncbi:MAG: glycosyltransferase family 2 protein [Clostridia bacterium]
MEIAAIENNKYILDVSVVIPVFNEENYIEKCIESVINQNYSKESFEFILVDGNSSDKTVEIIKQYMKKYSYIRLLENPKRTVQFGLNIGMQNAKGKYIVRMDAHSEYADDYIEKSIYYLKNTDAVNVGGPMIAKGKTDVQKAIAAAYHSSFALGGGKNHEIGYEGYADTGYYDQMLDRNEDDDLNFRLHENSKKIFITPKIESVYYPRSKYRDVFKQYYEYGLWKVAVIKKHKKPARISHLIPLCFVLYLLIFGIFSCFFPIVAITFMAINILYLICDIYFSFTNSLADNFVQKLRLLWIHFILHISYGIGFLFGVFKFFNTKFDYNLKNKNQI